MGCYHNICLLGTPKAFTIYGHCSSTFRVIIPVLLEPEDTIDAENEKTYVKIYNCEKAGFDIGGCAVVGGLR